MWTNFVAGGGELGAPEKIAAAAVERHPCPQCDVPAGSACRTRARKTAAKYHTARFILVPEYLLDVAVVLVDPGARVGGQAAAGSRGADTHQSRISGFPGPLCSVRFRAGRPSGRSSALAALL
ncbi:hypothetical protein [Amycolatopsis sp. NPDC059021]|uniref:zinc finger domain-containing protein n=1 Tax=Amycolatopsis sp. NPDC059021 TaxID=3346704 RepID=UPI0036715899